MSSSEAYLELPLGRFLDDIAARTPSPGGGCVAAVAGALAAALSRMVVEYTAGRKNNAAHAPRLRAILDELTKASELFGQLMREDMAAYEQYVAARASGDPAEQQRSTGVAVAVPMEIAAVAEAVAARLDEIKTLVSLALYSDVQVGVILAAATADSAACTAESNLAYLADPAEAAGLRRELARLLAGCGRHRESILSYRPK